MQQAIWWAFEFAVRVPPFHAEPEEPVTATESGSDSEDDSNDFITPPPSPIHVAPAAMDAAIVIESQDRISNSPASTVPAPYM